ncbi:MAG: DUF7901 domain-containing protein, partial [Planctomycetota bacterium]
YDPRTGVVELAKFEFYQKFNPYDWWYQPGDNGIYWLGITALYDDAIAEPNNPWGWETRPHFFMDDAVRLLEWPEPGMPYSAEMFEPIMLDSNSWDLSFELISKLPEPKPPVPNLKWSQPPIEWDPTADVPLYCGWDEPSYLLDYPSSGSTLVYRNWDANDVNAVWLPLEAVAIADGMSLTGTERQLDHYDFAIYGFEGTAPYTVMSELWTEAIDPCGFGYPGVPIPETYCDYLVNSDGYVVLDCAPGTGAILPDDVWMVLWFTTSGAGWVIGEAAELGFTDDYWAENDGGGWELYWLGGDPYAGYEANIWCESQPDWAIMVADDFRCLGPMPVTSIHWWGSYVGWEEPDPPPQEPSAWRIGFWSNVPVGSPPEPEYSYPDTLLWQIEVDANRVHVDWVGNDWFPPAPGGPAAQFMLEPDTCFQYYIKLEPNEWFWQDHYVTRDNVYWLSIAAIYDPCDGDPCYPWGWKTRPWSWMDDAVRFTLVDEAGPGIVLDPSFVEPIEDPVYFESFDMAFELDTDPCYVKWQQPFSGIRHWPHYEDEESMAIVNRWTDYKWQQDPNPVGWDVAFLSFDGQLLELADDWPCDETGTVDDIHFWYSWSGDVLAVISEVTVRIYSNNPSGGSGYSEPNELKWERTFSGNQFTWFLWGMSPQGWLEPLTGIWYPGNHQMYYYLSIDNIDDPFIQEEGNIYWLSIELVCGPYYPGWKTTFNVWNDSAVFRTAVSGGAWRQVIDPTSGLGMDFAFELTTEKKELDVRALVADDWPCDQNTPITAAAWWGSYIGYTYKACQGPPPVRPVKPDYFWLTIWDDLPDPNPFDPTDYSHPNNIIWKYDAYDFDEVLVGYDKHREGGPNEPVFRYSVRIPEEEWFCQDEANDVYWFSVVAVYEDVPDYNWGWTNHKHIYNDDAVTGYPDVGGPAPAWSWSELYDQTQQSEDMSFILFTWPWPPCWGYLTQCHGDADGDGWVKGSDFLALKASWYKCYPDPLYNPCADFDRNGCVKGSDFLILKKYWYQNPPADCPRGAKWPP